MVSGGHGLRARRGGPTSKHVFSLFIVDDGTGLEFLRPEPVGDGQGLGFGRAGLDWLLLLLLLLLGLLLGLHLGGHGLLAQALDVFLDGDAVLLGLGGQLLLDLLDLLGRGPLAVGSEGDRDGDGFALRRGATGGALGAHGGGWVGGGWRGEWRGREGGLGGKRRVRRGRLSRDGGFL